MFYDNFTEDQICGIFSPTHIVVMICLILLLIVAVIFSRKLSLKATKRIILAICITVWILEVIKDSIRIYKGAGGDSWIPLYFCGIFLYAIVLVQFKSQTIQDIGWSFITFGGIGASIGFIIMPSTSLALYPIWHPGSIHSLIFHWLMAYTGLVALVNGVYKPKASHFIYYFYFTGLMSVIAVLINNSLGTNMMFLDNPFGIPWLAFVKEYSSTAYALVAWFGQCVMLYWISYGVYLAFIKIKNLIVRRRNERSV